MTNVPEVKSCWAVEDPVQERENICFGDDFSDFILEQKAYLSANTPGNNQIQEIK